MQYLNDDMDELFRKAADGYSLNTNGADWEKVKAKLAEETTAASAADYRFLWLLLLLPLTLLCNRLTDSPYFATPSVTVAPALPATAAAQGLKRPAVLPDHPLPAQPIGSAGPRRREAKREKVLVPATTVQWDKKHLPRQPAAKNINSLIENETGSSAGLNLALLPAEQKATVSADSALWAAEDHIPTETLPDDWRTAPVFYTDSEARQQQKPAAQPRKKRFYAGLAAGPDLSTVRFEKFSRVGIQAGLFVGYAFHQRWAVEAGVLSSKKYYYSEGEYVKTSGGYTPTYAKLLSVDGNCRMLELPLSLRYTILQTKKRSLFGTAGISSYLMQAEEYTYDYLYLASGNVVSYRRTYSDKPKNWFSTLQLSVGYTLAPHALGVLRIEPYYAIPLKGVGHGKLPLSSVGVRLGIMSNHF